jgi:4'-phosphopantetheinyl transferase
LPVSEQEQGFYNAWTRKEAFIKAVGDGLHYPLDKFQVELDPARLAKVLEIEGDSGAAASWELHDFIPAPQYTAALALPRLHNHYHFYI